MARAERLSSDLWAVSIDCSIDGSAQLTADSADLENIMSYVTG